jgi:RPA family protein
MNVSERHSHEISPPASALLYRAKVIGTLGVTEQDVVDGGCRYDIGDMIGCFSIFSREDNLF